MIDAALLFLKGISPRVWLAIGAAVLFIGYTAAVYDAGGNAPRAALAKLQTGIEAAHATQVKEDARREAAHQTLVKGKDDERAQAVAAVAASWKSYADSLQHAAAGRAGADAKPVPIAAGRCDNAAGNQDVSAAVSKYRDDVRAIVADARAAANGLRDGAAGLLEVCDKQTGALIRTQAWAAEEQRINRAP